MSSSVLTRAIGLPHATAIVVGIIIGASVFVQASEITARVPSLWGVTLAWVTAGLLTMGGALVCAELSSAFPRTGGVYVFLREIYSPALGFLWGWAMFWSMHTGIAAAIATVFARYAAYFVPMGDASLRGVAVAAILVLSAVNYLGVRFGSGVQTAFTVMKVVAVAAIIVVGSVLDPAPGNVAASTVPADFGVGDFLLAVGAGLFAFGGWHMVTYTAEETKNPERTIPRALVLGTLIVTVCYVGLNIVYLSVLPIERVIASSRVAADTFEALVGPAGGSFVSALVMLSAFGALNGVILAGPRVYYSMAQDGLLFKWAAAVHPTNRTPGRAIVLQGFWAAILVLTGTYRDLFTRVIYTEWIFFALLAIGVVLLRGRAGYRPQWRMPGVPVIPVAFAAVSLAIAANQIRVDPLNSAIGLGMVLVGLPVYWVWIRRARRAMSVAVLATAIAAPSAAIAQTRASAADRDLARDIFRELIAIDTSEPDGNPRAGAEAMAKRLMAAGFTPGEVRIVGAEPRLGNLVVRLRGAAPSGASEGGPLLLMAHIDVVPARRDDWSLDPFVLTEKDGYFYGRGTHDNKAGAAMLVANVIRLRREGFRPVRDIVIVLTADEETTGNGIRWLLANDPDVKRAALALNTDAGDGMLQGDRRLVLGVQASEKVYVSYQLEVRNPGGHSSVPRPDNAIYQLAHALSRLSKHQFPVKLNEVTRTYLSRTGELGGPEAADMRRAGQSPPDPAAIERLAGNPSYGSAMRTTCVATMLEGGHAENALPQTARAVVNCRVLPGERLEEVERALTHAIADKTVTLRRLGEPTTSPPSPLTQGVMSILERLTGQHFPGAVVIPEMSAGATDGLYARNAGIPVYGASAIFFEPDDVRAHGRDERIPVRSFYDAFDFWYDMVRAFSGGQ